MCIVIHLIHYIHFSARIALVVTAFTHYRDHKLIWVHKMGGARIKHRTSV